MQVQYVYHCCLCLIFDQTSGYLLAGKLDFILSTCLRNFNSTVQISEFIHFHPLLRSHDFRPVLGSFAGPYSTMFYIHARSRVPEFFKGEGGVASTLGYTRGRYYLSSLVSLLYNDIFIAILSRKTIEYRSVTSQKINL